jgi:hypothetical protein
MINKDRSCIKCMNQVEMIDNKLMYEQVDKRKKRRFVDANDGVR